MKASHWQNKAFIILSLMMTTTPAKKDKFAKPKDPKAKNQLQKNLFLQFFPLIAAVTLWAITMGLVHLPSIRDDFFNFFVRFTVESVVLLGKITFLPIQSPASPNLTVAGYPMQVIMECTAYNFYIFVIYLSLLSPVRWTQRLTTLAIFIPSVFLLNSLRFITMGYIGRYFPNQFDVIHEYLWNILFGFLVFLIWVWRYQNTKPDKAPQIL